MKRQNFNFSLVSLRISYIEHSIDKTSSNTSDHTLVEGGAIHASRIIEYNTIKGKGYQGVNV